MGAAASVPVPASPALRPWSPSDRAASAITLPLPAP